MKSIGDNTGLRSYELTPLLRLDVKTSVEATDLIHMKIVFDFEINGELHTRGFLLENYISQDTSQDKKPHSHQIEEKNQKIPKIFFFNNL